MNSERTFNRYWYGQFRRFFGGSDGVFVNPIRKSGVSYFAFQALFELGLNQWHSTGDVINHLKELMSSVAMRNGDTCWESYCNRVKSKNGSVSANIHNILMTLQTLYGARLVETGCCVDILKTDSETLLRLNTRSPLPTRQRSRVGGNKQARKPSFWSRFFTWIMSLLMAVSHSFNRSSN